MPAPYPKKIARKQLRLKESTNTPEQRYYYPDAIALVRQARSQGRYNTACFYLEQIDAQINTLSEPGLYLMSIYLDAMAIEPAGIIARRMLRKFPRDPEVLYHCSRFFQQSNNIDQAMELLAKSIALYPRRDDHHELLGQLLRSIGNSDAALKAFNKSLKINPGNTAAILGKAKLLGSRSGSAFIEGIRSIIASETLTPLKLAQLHFALAWFYERSEPDVHFEHLDKANAAMALTRPYDPGQITQQVDKLITRYGKPTAVPLAHVVNTVKAPIFIASLPRSGSTLLEQMLGAHSDVTPIGESAAFGSALRSANPASDPTAFMILPEDENERGKRVTSVSSAFQDNFFVRGHTHTRLLDKSISNYFMVGAILEVFPDAKIIGLHRHPFDVVYSCYKQDFASGVNESFKLEHMAHAVKTYQRLMAHWSRQYPGQILSISYEELVGEPEKSLRRILAYCDLEWQQDCLQFQRNVGLIKTSSDAQVREPVSTKAVDSWKVVEAHLAPAIKILGDQEIPD